MISSKWVRYLRISGDVRKHNECMFRECKMFQAAGQRPSQLPKEKVAKPADVLRQHHVLVLPALISHQLQKNPDVHASTTHPFIHSSIPSHPIPSHPIPSHPIPFHSIPFHSIPFIHSFKWARWLAWANGMLLATQQSKVEQWLLRSALRLKASKPCPACSRL